VTTQLRQENGTVWSDYGALVELRLRNSRGMGQYFGDVGQLRRVEARIAELARTTDVFVGVVPRRRRGGGRADLVDEVAVAWADCDGAEAVGALRRFRPRPSMVVASGSGCNRHAYWFLREPVAVGELERANKRLAVALAADPASTDGARILRPAGSLSFKACPPVPVSLLLSSIRVRVFHWPSLWAAFPRRLWSRAELGGRWRRGWTAIRFWRSRRRSMWSG
jgi:hypothetical protein